MKLPFFGRRLSKEAFADRFVRELTGRAPDLEIRSLGELTLRLAGRNSEQRVHLDNAFAQYQKDPGGMEDIFERWCSFLVAGMASAGVVSLDAVVPLIKGHEWIDQQRAYHVEQFGEKPAFSMCWEPYNAALILVYAEFKEGLRFLRAEDLKEGGLDLPTLRDVAISNLRRRTRELRIMGGGDEVIVICAEGNLEPSLILLADVWEDSRVRVDGDRLVTIAERGFAITCGASNVRHIWQLAADAAESYRKAEYPVSPHLFEQRGDRFEVVDVGDEDPTHPIADPSNLDIQAVKQGGGSDLVIVIASPLQADPRSICRLFQKVDNYLQFILSDKCQKQCGAPSPQSTRIIARLHPKTDPAVVALLESLGDWVSARNATLVLEPVESLQ